MKKDNNKTKLIINSYQKFIFCVKNIFLMFYSYLVCCNSFRNEMKKNMNYSWVLQKNSFKIFSTNC